MASDSFNPSLPDDRFDSDGYPIPSLLEWIESWDPFVLPSEAFAEMLYWCFWMPEWCYDFKRPYKGHRTLSLHTGGWSGNEEVIEALKKNVFFFPMCWEKTVRGGHYYFRVPVRES